MKLTNLLLLLVAIGCYGDVITDAEQFVKSNESFRAHRYRDARGWAIGYGFTDPKYTCKEYMDQSEADKILHEIILDIDTYLDKRIYVDLSDSQRIALIDFVYQYGKTRFLNSNLRCLINVRAKEGKILEAFTSYNQVNGVYNDGVAKRSQRRATLWQK